MKKIVTLYVLVCFNSIFAQIGINTTSPNAQLEIKSSNQAAPANTDGLLIPKIDAFPATNPTVLQQGMIVYLTTISGVNQPGFYSWDNVSASWKSIASNSSWGLTGNSGTIDGTNFIGTTDNIPLNFRLNNQKAGRIENATNYNTFLGYQSGNLNTASFNTGFGYQTLRSNTTGSDNVAIGVQALVLNTTGSNNVAIGKFALQQNTIGSSNVAIGLQTLLSNTTGAGNVAVGIAALPNNTVGISNTAVGSNALFNNSSGNDNTANGYQSLISNTLGNKNTASGYFALYSNITGNYNSAFGDEALTFNTTSSNNTATGYGALYFNTGADNTANGYQSLNFNTTGTSNVAMGYQSLLNNNSGNYNTAEGVRTLITNTSGEFNTGLGYNAYPLSSSLSNYTGIGYNVGGGSSSSNMVEIGNSSVSVIRGQVNFSTYSDARIKTNVKANVPGLSFINQLRPVTYNLDIHKQNELMYLGKKDDKYFEGKYDIEKITQTGFIAQEVEAAAKNVNYDFNGVNVPKTTQELYSVSYSEFVVPLVKAVQEQQEIIQADKARIKALEDRLQNLEKKFLK